MKQKSHSGEKIAEKNCDIKGCSNSFPQKATGRLRITKKGHKGELVAWICPPHGKDLEDQIEWGEE
ncbi:hypothetical protein AKJ41_03445 [candidate division MSBL1 archaeon SCGC-AAA259O05]|uniref:Uncharacterized protein n=2 Tax=candidate division MSBL1 TaxID=215777 RepID=A0A133V3B1_9EURY|nr:hypothetical protein AKJ64_00555 [candidate division MSBL1 archaeon SCGC-AAA259E17]KXB00920.1 hypothetical protein AKJ41_03445 [candidate division MSBL1 archaeon SCGC-AAA259O05]